MPIRSSHQVGSSNSKSVGKIARLRDKALRLRDRIKQMDLAMFKRREARLAWWQRAFRTPLVGFYGWVTSRTSTLWAAFLSILGLNAKAASRGSLRRPAPVRRSHFRSTLCESLEQRQMMAADITAINVGTYTDVPGAAVDSAVTSNPTPGITVSLTAPLVGGEVILVDANGNGIFENVPTEQSLLAGTFPVVANKTIAAKVVNAPVLPLAVSGADDAVSITLDTTAPTVAINQKATQLDPVGGLPAPVPVVFSVKFSEPINTATFNGADVAVTTTGAGIVALAPTVAQVAPFDGTNFEVSVPWTNTGNPGSMSASILAGGIQDLATNVNAASFKLAQFPEIHPAPFVPTTVFATTATLSQFDLGNVTPPDVQNFATDYDDFTLTAATPIAGFSWVGRYESNTLAGLNPDFKIAIYQDFAGQPGGVPIQVFSGKASEQADTNAGWFRYSAPINPVTLGAGTYWVSIVAQLDFGVDGWRLGFSAVPGTSVQDFQNFTTKAIDRFFDPVNYAINVNDSSVTLIPAKLSYTPAIDANDTPPAEGGPNGQFRVYIDQPALANVVVTYAVEGALPFPNGVAKAAPLSGGTFADPNDYETLSGTVTIPAGQTSALISVNVFDDDTAEINSQEKIALRLLTIDGSGLASSFVATTQPGVNTTFADTLFIQDNDASVLAIQATDDKISTENSGDTGAFKVSLTKVSTTPTNVWLTVPQSNPTNALFGTDYTFAVSGGGSLSAAPETRTITNRVLLSDVATLTTGIVPHNYVVGQSVTISGMTGGDAVFNGSVVVTGIPTAFTFTYARPGNPDIASGAPAGAGLSTTNSNALLTIPAGVLEVTLTATPIGDTTVELDETIVVNLVSLKGQSLVAPTFLPSLPTIGGANTATVTIIDDDTSKITLLPVPVTIPDPTGANGNDPDTLPGLGFPGSTDNGGFIVQLSNPVSQSTTVNYTISAPPANGNLLLSNNFTGGIGTFVPGAAANGQVGVVAVSGNNVLELRRQSNTNPMVTANSATFTVNLAGIKTAGGAVLSFDQTRLATDSDQNFAGLTTANAFTVNPDVDGVAISVDGTNWFPVMNLSGTGSYSINLERALYQRGLEPNSTVSVRFLQFDNGTGNNATSGRQFDNIRLVTGDYDSLSGSVVVPANTTQFTIPMTVINDLVVEGSENLTVTLSSLGAGFNPDVSLDSLPVNLTQTATITDSDTALVVIDGAANGSELGLVPGQFRVRLTNVGHTLPMRSSTNTIIPFQATGLTLPSATYGVDYTISGTNVTFNSGTLKGTILIPAGETQGFITVNVLQESAVEDDEFVSLLLLNAGADLLVGDPEITVSNVQAAIAITDEDSSLVRLNAANNGSEPGTKGVFFVDMVRTVDAVNTFLPLQNVTSNVNTVITYTVAAGPSPIANPAAAAGGTVANPNDYQTLTGTVTITAGQTFATIDVNVFDDLTLEQTETVTVTLTGKIAGDSSTFIHASQKTDTVNILDNDTLLVKVTKTLDGAENGPLTPGANNTVGFDPLLDGKFTIFLDGTVSIVNQYASDAGALGAAGNVVVTYSLSGTASNGLDYQSLNGTATILAGQTSVEVVVDVIDDNFFDPSETVTLTLSSVTAQPALGLGGQGVKADASPATVTIVDDEVGQVTISNIVDGRESGSNGSVRFQLSGPTPFNTVVTYAVTPSGAAPIATQGADHNFLSGTVTFTAGQTQQTVVVPILNDTVKEDVEIIPVQITGFAPGGNGAGFVADLSVKSVKILADQTVDVVNQTNGREGALAAGIVGRSVAANLVTITTGAPHNFVPGQTVTVAGLGGTGFNGTFSIFSAPTATTFTYISIGATVGGSAVGTATPSTASFTIGMQAASSSPTVVTYQIVPAAGNAIDGTDFATLAPFTATIPVGQTTVVVPLTITDDLTIEDTENLSIRLVSVSNATDPDITIGAAVPTNVSRDRGIEIIGKSHTGTLATLTTARPHGLVVGQAIEIQIGDANFDTNSAVINAASGNTFTYSFAGVVTPQTAASGFAFNYGFVSTKSLTSNVATITTFAPHGLRVGQPIRVSINDPVFDGTAVVTAVTANTVSYSRVGANVASTASGGFIDPDAGDLPVSAAVTSGSYGLTQIRGQLTGNALANGADFQDMFLIRIDDPAAFTANTVGSSFDTQLFLFQPSGVGITSNDDTFGVQAALTNPLPFPIAPGLYYLAISGFGSDPTSGAGNGIWLTDTNIAPNGVGALGAVNGWTGPGATGDYVINLTGASFANYDTSATLSIFDNDAGYIQVTGLKGKEGVNDVTFTITQSAIASTDTVVTYTLSTPASPNNANPNGVNGDHTLDYAPTIYTATIGAGSTSVVVTVPVVDDAIVESDTETVILTLNAIVSGDPQIQLGTVNGPTLTFQQGSVVAGSVYGGTSDTFINNDIPLQSYDTQAFISAAPLVTPPVGPTSGPLHGLIRFDNIVGSGLIPANSPITSTTITFGGPLGVAPNLHLALQAWAANGNWSSLFGGNGIQNNGVEASSTGLTLAGGTLTGTPGSNAALLAWIQGWVNGGANNGLAILPNAGNWDANSSESAGFRPQLSITVATAASAVIEDNDSATVTLSSVNGIEPGGSKLGLPGQTNAGKAILTLDKVSSTNTVVRYTVADGTATGGGIDHNEPTGLQTVTILAGQTSATIFVEVTDDFTVEGQEDVTVTLVSFASNDPQVAFDAVKATSVKIDDNDVGTISISKIADGSENNPVPVNVTNKVLTSNIVTLTTSVPHTFTIGEQVLVTIGDVIFDGEFVVTAVPTPTTFQYTKFSSNVPAAVASGSAANQPTDGKFLIQTTNASNTPTLIPYSILLNAPLLNNATLGASNDYQLKDGSNVLSGTITLPALLTSVEVTLDVLEDSLNEGDENVTVQLLAPVGKLTLGAPTTSTAKILDDDDLIVTVATPDNSVTEGKDAGVNDGLMTINLNFVSDSDVQVVYVVGGTATAGAPQSPIYTNGNDYIPLPGTAGVIKTVVIPAGQTTFNLPVEAYQDFFLEGNETVTVNATTIETFEPTTKVVSNNSVDKTLGANTGSVTIVDETYTLTIARTDSPAKEPGLGFPLGSNGQFTVTMANPLPSPVVVVIEDITPVALGKATIGTGSGADYNYSGSVSKFQTVTIQPGQTQATLTVSVLDDLLSEGDEAVDVRITNAGVTYLPSPGLAVVGAPNTATETIFDNDVANATITAANGKDKIGGADNGQFIISIGTPSLYNTTVSYAVKAAGTTATAGSDYTTIPAGFVVIPAGSTSATLTLNVIDDAEVEGDEFVQLEVTAVTSAGPNAVAGVGNTGTATIVDEDVATLKLTGTNNASEPSGVGFFTVEQSAKSSTNTVISFSVSGGSATVANDYANFGSTTVTITAGQTQALIPVSVLDDSIVELNPETVQLTLAGAPSVSDPQVTVNLAQTTSTIDISDNDFAKVLFSKVQDGKEGGNNVSYRVDLVDSTSLAPLSSDINVIVTYEISGTANGGASNTNVVNGPDYQQLSATKIGTVTIPATATSATITANVFDDDFVENVENVTIRQVSVTTASPRAIALNTQTASVTFKQAAGVNAQLTTASPHGLVPGQLVVIAIGDPVFDGLQTLLAGTAGSTLVFTKANATNVPALTPAVGSATVTAPLTSAINGGALVGGVVTLNTAAAHGLLPGQVVTIAMNPADPIFDGTYVLQAGTSGTQLVYNRALANAVAGAVGTAVNRSNAHATIDDNDQSTLTISGGSFAEGNQIFDQAGATLTLSLTKAYDIPTTWNVNYGTGVNGTVAITARDLTSNVATLTVGAHTFVVGQKIGVAMTPADPVFDGQYVISAVTATTISYARVGSNVASAAATGAVTVSGAAIIGGADNQFGTDFDGVFDTITIPAGALTATVKVDFNEEGPPNAPQTNLVEDNEFFLTNVTGTLPVGYTITNNGKSVVTISNDDTATYKINDTASVNELNPVTTAFNGTKSLTGNVATITTVAAHGLTTNDTIEIAVGDTVFDGRFAVTVVNANTFTYAKVNANVPTAATAGTITAFPQATLQFQVSVDNPVDMPISLQINYVDDAGVLGAKGASYVLALPLPAGTDYNNDPATVNFGTGVVGTQFVNVLVNADNIVEGGTAANPGFETLTSTSSVKASSFAQIPQGGRLFNNLDTGKGAIVDQTAPLAPDTAVVSISVVDGLGSEGPPTDDAKFKISQSFPSSVDTVIKFNVSTGVNQAIQGSDYDLKVGASVLTNTVTIPSGQTEIIMDIAVLSDLVLEDDEFVTVTLDSFVSADPNVSIAVGPSAATAQINDNDVASLKVTKTKDGAEPGAPANDGEFTVSLTNPSDSNTVVVYRVLNPLVPADVLLGAVGPAATAGADYAVLTGTVTIPANSPSATILVDVLNDFIPNEGTERVSIYIDSFTGNADISIDNSSRAATVNIAEDGDGLFVKVTKVKDAAEPGTGPDDGQFMLTLVDSLGVPVVLPSASTGGAGGITVNFSLTGTASSPTDFSNISTGFIAEGQSTGLVTIDVQDDLVIEPTETVIITLNGTSPSFISRPGPTTEPVSLALTPNNVATLNITDNDSPATIASRGIFYNSSSFDANGVAIDNVGPTFDDNAAIASDKVPLMPGGTATFVNYTSYSRGINGIIVDIGNLAATPTLGTLGNFFQFRVGNNNNPSTWTPAPPATSVTAIAGAGNSGSTRVYITFADNAIQKQWLQVIVLANANTGLTTRDVHYWGNAIGETGTPNLAGTFATVDSTDVLQANSSPSGFVLQPVVNTYDFNRDKFVNSSDVLIANSNPSGFSPLILFTAPASGSGAEGEGAAIVLQSAVPLDNFVPTESQLAIAARKRQGNAEFYGPQMTNLVQVQQLAPKVPSQGQLVDTVLGDMAKDTDNQSVTSLEDYIHALNSVFENTDSDLGL